MPLFLCCAHLAVPTSTSHLVSDTASVEQAALSSLYMFLSCVALHASCAKTVWIGHVDKGRDALHHFSHSSVKGIVICKSHCHSLCLFSFTKFLWTRVRFRYKWLVQPKLHQEVSFWHPLPCHVLFQDYWGDYIVVHLDVFQYSTSKGLRRNILFLCRLPVPLPCSFERSKCFMRKTLAYLFLRIC